MLILLHSAIINKPTLNIQLVAHKKNRTKPLYWVYNLPISFKKINDASNP